MQLKRLLPFFVAILVVAAAFLSAQPAVAAPPAQAEDEAAAVGLYVALVPAEDGSEQQVTIFLWEDGTAEVALDAQDGEEQLLDYGTWELAGDDSLTITIVGNENEEYPEPIATSFAVGEGTLTTTGEEFGPDGVTFYQVQDEAELAAVEEEVTQAGVGGVYATDALPQEDGRTIVALAYLMEDGSAQLVANYFGVLGLPLVEAGTWATHDDGSVTVTLTEKVEIGADGPALTTMDKPAESKFTVGEDGELVGGEGDFTFYPVAAAEAPEVTGEAKKAVFVQVVPATADKPETTIQVVLVENGGGGMVTIPNGEEPQVQLGYWEGTPDALKLTLVGTPDEPNEQPIEFVFKLDGDQLIATEWDKELYGEEPLNLIRLEVALQKLGEIQAALGDDGSADDASAAAEPAVKHLSLVRPATQKADAEYLASVEDGADSAKPKAFVFQSEVLPVADGEEVQLTIVAFEDGTFAWLTDALDGEEPVVEFGTWESVGDSGAQAQILGTQDEEYVEPIPLEFQKAEDGVSLLVTNPDLFGEDGLMMNPVKTK